MKKDVTHGVSIHYSRNQVKQWTLKNSRVGDLFIIELTAKHGVEAV
jgi:hypothetical protein